MITLEPEPSDRTQPETAGGRRRSPFPTIGVVLASILISIVGIVVAILAFRWTATVVPQVTVMYVVAVIAGTVTAAALSLLLLSKTRRRKDRSASVLQRTRTSAITSGVTGVVLIALVVLVALPVDGPGRPKEPENTNYAELSTGSRIAWWETKAKQPSDKPPVVYLHGGPGYFVGGTEEIVDALAEEGRDVYYFDQVGAGLSEILPSEEYGIERLVDDLDAFRQEVVKSDEISLVGHSFGGFFAEAYATSHPGVIEKVALINPLNYALPPGMTDEQAEQIERPPAAPGSEAPKSPEPSPQIAIKLLVSNDLTEINPVASESFLPQEQLLNAFAVLLGSKGGLNPLVNTAVDGSSRKIADDVMADISTTKLPTLVIRSEFDYILWPSLRLYRDLNPNAQMVYVPGADHSTALDPENDTVSTALRSFFDEEPLTSTYDGEEDPYFFFTDQK